MDRSRLLLAVACLAAGCGAAGKAPSRPWVRTLRLHGVKQVPVKALQGGLATRQTSRWPLARKRLLSAAALAEDRRRIESFYQAQGHFQARVLSTRVEPRKGNSVAVDITVEEGAPTRIAAVEVTGLDALPGEGAAQVRAALALRPGQVLVHARYLEEKELLLQRLRALGRAWAEVEGAVEVDRDTRLARIQLAARVGPQVTFGQVRVEGTVQVDAWRVARAAEIPTGRPFHPGPLERARLQVLNLGVFSSVKVEYVPCPGRPDLADVRISVREGKFREVRLGAGLSFESQRTAAQLEAVYNQRNFLGGLRVFRASAELGYVVIPAFWDPQLHGPQLAAEARLTQPDALWRRSELRASLGYDVGIEYGYQYHGPRAQLGLSWPLWQDRVRMGVSYGFQFLDFFNTEEGILQDPARAGRLFGYQDPYRLAWIQEQVSLDLRDRPLNARRGVYLALTAEQGGAYTGGAFTYEMLLGEARGYLPLGRRLVVAARAQFGHIFVHSDVGSPITRRFYAGGSNSHRGFSYNRLSRQVPACAPPCEDPPIPIGGDEIFLGQAELRLDLFRLFGSWISMVGFFDVGDVAPAGERVDFTQLHYATGGGLRYATVIGTLRFDLGVRLNRLDDPERDPDPGSRFAFHISIGEAF